MGAPGGPDDADNSGTLKYVRVQFTGARSSKEKEFNGITFYAVGSGTTVDYVAEKLKQGHSSEKVQRKIPVYVAYFTAWPTMSGTVEYFADIYDRDEHLKTAIEKTDAVRAPTVTTTASTPG